VQRSISSGGPIKKARGSEEKSAGKKIATVKSTRTPN
jgi:hypothetical protein